MQGPRKFCGGRYLSSGRPTIPPGPTLCVIGVFFCPALWRYGVLFSKKRYGVMGALEKALWRYEGPPAPPHARDQSVFMEKRGRKILCYLPSPPPTPDPEVNLVKSRKPFEFFSIKIRFSISLFRVLSCFETILIFMNISEYLRIS